MCSHGLLRSRWVGVVCICASVAIACVCASGCVGSVHPPWSWGALCVTHVKFMFCAAFTKEPWNGFWGKITPQQREDGAKDNEMDGKQSAEKRDGEEEGTKEER